MNKNGKINYKRVTVPPDKLLLDLENPRFGLKAVSEQQDALNLLAERANLKELWESIVSQSWLDLEPIVCIQTAHNGIYIVIEGNRRLAAIQTLLEPSKLEDHLQKRVLALPESVRSDLENIEIVVVEDRRKADAFIGFKHVNGPASWGSLAKAKFASDMFQRHVDQEWPPDEALKRISQTLGDTTTSMLRMLVGYQVLQQAIRQDYVRTERIESGTFDFSHLYTMMPNPATRSFLGWGDGPLRTSHVQHNPVSEENLRNLELLMGWLFGNEDLDRVIKSQGSDRPKLQQVLAHSAAKETLIATGRLETAAAKAGLDIDSWRTRLIRAETQAKEISTDLPEIQFRLKNEALDDSISRSKVLRTTYGNILAALSNTSED